MHRCYPTHSLNFTHMSSLHWMSRASLSSQWKWFWLFLLSAWDHTSISKYREPPWNKSRTWVITRFRNGGLYLEWNLIFFHFVIRLLSMGRTTFKIDLRGTGPNMLNSVTKMHASLQFHVLTDLSNVPSSPKKDTLGKHITISLGETLEMYDYF